MPRRHCRWHSAPTCLRPVKLCWKARRATSSQILRCNMPTLASSSPRAGLVCVGSELLRGKLNTHASLLARRLASVGIDLTEEHTVADDLEALRRTIRGCLDRCAVVIVTGGLGPTFDDISREAAAA